MSQIYVKPGEGRVVPLPRDAVGRIRNVADEGQWVELTPFIHRRLRDQDLVEVAPPEAKPASPAATAPTAATPAATAPSPAASAGLTPPASSSSAASAATASVKE